MACSRGAPWRLVPFSPFLPLGPAGTSPETIGVMMLSASKQAMLASIGKHTLRAYTSEVKLWCEFCTLHRIRPVPAKVASVLQYLALFRNGRSAVKYICALRFFHDFNVASREGTDAPAVRRALLGKMKSTAPLRKAPSISPEDSAKLSRCAFDRHDPNFALIATLASAFMFRVPNELLPLQFAGPHSTCTVTRVDGRSVVRIWLASRKNAPDGAVLSRPCVCQAPAFRADSCPVHALFRWCQCTGRSPGSPGPLFALSAQQAGRKLREYAELCDLPYAGRATLQGFRRGRAQWLIASRKPLSVVLRSGGWRSAAFLEYLEREEITEAAFLDILAEEDEHDVEVARTERPLAPSEPRVGARQPAGRAPHERPQQRSMLTFLAKPSPPAPCP